MSIHRKKHFTLIELLVAMGLFSLLVVLMLQLFSGAQRLWIASDKRNNIHSDARVAMELMSDLISSVVFSCGEDINGNRDTGKDAVFSLDTVNKDTAENTDSNTITLAVRTNRDLPKKENNTRFISFRRGSGSNRGKLYMTVFCDKRDENAFYNYFPPYGIAGSGVENRSQAKSALNAALVPSDAEGVEEYNQVIAENVVGLKFTSYELTGSPEEMTKQSDDTDIAEPPYLIQIQLSLLDKDSYDIYTDMPDGDARDKFLDRNKRTFTRSVFIGNRWALLP